MSQNFNAYQVGEASKMEKFPHYIDSEGKKDDRNAIVSRKSSIGISMSTVK